MRPEELLNAVGMIKDEYIDEAAPKAEVERITSEPGGSADEKKWRGPSRRRSGWMRYGSVAAAAALLVIVFGVTQLGGRLPDKADSSSAAPADSAVSDSGAAAQESEKAEESTADGVDGSWYSSPENAPSLGGDDDMLQPNPMEEIDRDIMASEDGVAVTLPEGATEEIWFRYLMEPLIDEVRFTYGGREVYFRAQKVDRATGEPIEIEAFTGLYYDWDKGVHAVYDTLDGGYYTAVDGSEGAAVLYWYSAEGDYIFSLSVSGDTVGNADECLKSLTEIYNDMEVAV